jgi:hypothetical protein
MLDRIDVDKNVDGILGINRDTLYSFRKEHATYIIDDVFNTCVTGVDGVFKYSMVFRIKMEDHIKNKFAGGILKQ